MADEDNIQITEHENNIMSFNAENQVFSTEVIQNIRPDILAITIIPLTLAGRCKLMVFSQGAIAEAIGDLEIALIDTKMNAWERYEFVKNKCEEVAEINHRRISWSIYYKLLELFGLDTKSPVVIRETVQKQPNIEKKIPNLDPNSFSFDVNSVPITQEGRMLVFEHLRNRELLRPEGSDKKYMGWARLTPSLKMALFIEFPYLKDIHVSDYNGIMGRKMNEDYKETPSAFDVKSLVRKLSKQMVTNINDIVVEPIYYEEIKAEITPLEEEPVMDEVTRVINHYAATHPNPEDVFVELTTEEKQDGLQAFFENVSKIVVAESTPIRESLTKTSQYIDFSEADINYMVAESGSSELWPPTEYTQEHQKRIDPYPYKGLKTLN